MFPDMTPAQICKNLLHAKPVLLITPAESFSFNQSSSWLSYGV